MSRFISQAATLRRLARAYRRMLLLSVPAALVACQGATDALAPDAADDPSAPAGGTEIAASEPALLVSNRIAYASHVAGGDFDIWTMGPQGGSPTRLTSFTGQEHSPTWSPDRKRIAFARQRSVGLDIYLMNADGTGKRWVRSTASTFTVYRPSWSPDGSHLLVTIYYQGGVFVARLDPATGNMAFLAPAGAFAVKGDWPIYHPTGRIFYIDDTRKSIQHFTPGGAQAVVLTSTWYLADLAISPDGTRLAYAAALMDNNWEIYVMNLTTRATTRLTNSAGTDARPTWSPDGTKLAFYSSRSGKAQIWTMNSSTGGSLTRITNATHGASSPAWAR
jgi:Tol biopolymer transport system component